MKAWRYALAQPQSCQHQSLTAAGQLAVMWPAMLRFGNTTDVACLGSIQRQLSLLPADHSNGSTHLHRPEQPGPDLGALWHKAVLCMACEDTLCGMPCQGRPASLAQSLPPDGLPAPQCKHCWASGDSIDSSHLIAKRPAR